MKLWLPVLLILCGSSLLAEEPNFVSAYAVSYPQSAIEAVQEPLRWSGKDWLTAAGLAGIGTGLYFLDEDIQRLVVENRGQITEQLSDLGNKFGDKAIMFPAAGAVIAAGLLTDDPHTTDTGLLCLKSLILANAATTGLKYLTQRDRPSQGEGNGFWQNAEFSLGRDSFPSGHATVVWALAPVLVAQYPGEKWLPPVAYGVAGLTCYARMHDNRHWASDVFAGAVVGWLAARLTLKTTPRLQFWPAPDLNGLALAYTF